MSLLVEKVESQIEKYMSDLIGQAMTQALIDGDHEFFRRYDKYISPRLGLNYIYQISLNQIRLYMECKESIVNFQGNLNYSAFLISDQTDKIKDDVFRKVVWDILDEFDTIAMNIKSEKLTGKPLMTELSRLCDITQEILQDERW